MALDTCSQDTLKTGSGRLREEGARHVIRMRAGGSTYEQIARALDVSVGTVANAVKGRTHSWLDEERRKLLGAA